MVLELIKTESLEKEIYFINFNADGNQVTKRLTVN
jgi:hypothetical protein